MREWATKSDAWQRGFRDGYLGIADMPVEQFHSAYEIGQLSGMAERKALTRGENAEKGRKWRTANIEKSCAIVAAYRERNLEKERKRRREYMASVRACDPVGWREKLRTWFKSNRGKARTYEAKQRAARQGAEGSYTAEDVQIVLEAQLGLCFYCDEPLCEWHEDHFVPLSKGGTNYRCNIVLACADCNLRKGSRAPIEFLNWQMKTPVFWHERKDNGYQTV